MKYKVLKPMARLGQPFAVDDLIEIENEAEAERMIAAYMIAPIAEETDELQPVDTPIAAKVAEPAKTSKIGKKKA
jgi:hypothetical protein